MAGLWCRRRALSPLCTKASLNSIHIRNTPGFQPLARRHFINSLVSTHFVQRLINRRLICSAKWSLLGANTQRPLHLHTIIFFCVHHLTFCRLFAPNTDSLMDCASTSKVHFYLAQSTVCSSSSR